MDTSTRDESAPLISRYGIPAPVRDSRTPRERRLAIFFILASTLFERVAFYSLTTNMSFTLQSNATVSEWNPLHRPAPALYIFSGICYLSTLIFAVLSDGALGRGKTIIIGFGLYLIGYSLVTITASGSLSFCKFDTHNVTTGIPMNQASCAPSILATLIFTAIGAGAVKSNLAVFGAEQIQKSKISSRYFDKYVVAVNIGSMIASGIIPYVIYTSKDFFTAYLIALPMPFMAAVLFMIGWRYYIHVFPYETVVANYFPVLCNAFQSWRRYEQKNSSKKNQNPGSTSSTLLNASQSMSEHDGSIRTDHRPSAFLDYAKAPIGKFHDRIVDDVKSLKRALIVFMLLIPYWLMYNQKETTFQSQGEQMRSSTEPKYYVSLVTLGDPLTIIIGIFIFNAIIYKCLEVRHWSLSITAKLIIGMSFAFLSMCIVGTIEKVRQYRCAACDKNDLSIWIQIVEYTALGFSQLFAMVGSYEYAYFAAPLSAQSLFMSLHFCSAGIASFISVAYMAILFPTLSDLDFSCDKHSQQWVSYGYFFILGGVQLFFILIFVICEKKFEIVKLNPQQTETKQFVHHSSRDEYI